MTVDVIIDMRVRFGPARNQGGRPTCLAFALSDAHAASRPCIEPLSVEHLYFHAIKRKPGADPADGVALAIALDALRNDGQCAETGWPYLITLPADLGAWSPPASATPVFRRDSTMESDQLEEVVTYIEARRPVLLAMLLGERFYRPVNGIVDAGPGDRDTAYHALIAIGLGRTSTERAVLVRNSWGPTWGDRGHSWVTESYLRPRLYQTALISEA